MEYFQIFQILKQGEITRPSSDALSSPHSDGNVLFTSQPTGRLATHLTHNWVIVHCAVTFHTYE